MRMKYNNKVWALPVTMVALGLAMLTSCKEKFDHTIDTDNPIVVSTNPAANVEGVAVNSDLILTFNENVQKGEGDVLIIGNSDTIRLNVNSDDITIGKDKRIVTIDPPEDLEPDVPYTVVVPKGMVKDLLGNEFIGLADGYTWSFKTVGKSGLALTSMNPLPGSNGASIFKLELSFGTEVQKGTGTFTIFNADNNTRVAEVSIPGQNVVVDGKTVTVLLSTPLEFGTSYYVLAPAGSFTDAEGKAFEGFASPESWSFTTTTGSGNSLLVHLPFDYDLNDVSGNRFDARQGDRASTKVSFVSDPERGRVASFNAGSYAVLPKHNLLRPELNQSFSFSFWTKLTAIGSDPVLFSNSDWDSGGNPGFVFAIDGALTYTGPGSPGTGWLLKTTSEPGGGDYRLNWKANEMTPQAAPALADNQWHMVTAVYNLDTKKLIVYLDGVGYTNANMDLNKFAGALWDTENDYPMTIWEDGTGGYNASSDTRKELAGLMDDFRFYNKALSAAEVQSLYITEQK